MLQTRKLRLFDNRIIELAPAGLPQPSIHLVFCPSPEWTRNSPDSTAPPAIGCGSDPSTDRPAAAARLIAPIGLDVYRVSPILVGALAAAEPLGAIAVGIPLSTGWLRLNGRRALLRGSLLFLMGLAAMALSPWYWLAFVLLLIGGLGTAAFSNMQTTLILTEAPPATRSRVMGIVTMRIGTGPVGVMMIGILSGQVGPPLAILMMASLWLCGLSLVWRKLIKVQASL
jgi:MFS family permease